MSRYEAVVIGGGQTGLGASWHLTQLGIDHVVLERGLVGQTWRSERWDSFALNTPNWMNRLPGDDAPIEPRDAFQTRDALVARFEAYADAHGLPVRTGSEVTAVESSPHATGTYLVRTDADDEPIETRSVIVASGGQARPKRPAMADSLPGTIHQLHTAAYRSPSTLPGGAVLVVGSAQSGTQIAEDLVGAGRRVFLCTSPVGRLRRRQRGRDSLEWLTENGFYDVTPEQLSDPRQRTMPIPQISGVGRYGHTVSLQSLAELGVVLLGRPIEVRGDVIGLDASLGANIALGDRVSAELNALVERRIRDGGNTLPPMEPDPADEPHPDPASVKAPDALDLDASGVSTIIWATGYEADFGYLHVPVLDASGIPVHNRGMARLPRIHFLGLRWMTKRKSALVYAVEEETAALAERFTEG